MYYHVLFCVSWHTVSNCKVGSEPMPFISLSSESHSVYVCEGVEFDAAVFWSLFWGVLTLLCDD